MATILLVDDDDGVRGILHKALAGAGYEVEDAANGDLALAAYRRQARDLVITDLVMPEKDGLETIMALRGLNPTVKIIAISGGGRNLGLGQLYLDAAQAIGADRILAKPFTSAALLTAVAEVLADSNQEPRLAEG